jgi:hypothetical protein
VIETSELSSAEAAVSELPLQTAETLAESTCAAGTQLANPARAEALVTESPCAGAASSKSTATEAAKLASAATITITCAEPAAAQSAGTAESSAPELASTAKSGTTESAATHSSSTAEATGAVKPGAAKTASSSETAVAAAEAAAVSGGRAKTNNHTSRRGDPLDASHLLLLTCRSDAAEISMAGLFVRRRTPMNTDIGKMDLIRSFDAKSHLRYCILICVYLRSSVNNVIPSLLRSPARVR